MYNAVIKEFREKFLIDGIILSSAKSFTLCFVVGNQSYRIRLETPHCYNSPAMQWSSIRLIKLKAQRSNPGWSGHTVR